MGRNRKPTALKKLAGNPGKRPLPKNEPEPERAIPDPHADVKRDLVARAEWTRVSVLLYDLGLLTSVDGAALGFYCLAYSQFREAWNTLDEEGSIQINRRTGFESASPWIAIRDKAEKKAMEYLRDFGMTPASRTKIQVAMPKPEKARGFAALGIKKKAVG